MLVMVTHDNRIRRSLNGAVRARLVHRGPEPEPADGEPAEAVVQRSDVCAVPAAAIVGEAMLALTLADACMEKFGGDSIGETKRNCASYLQQVGRFPPRGS